MSYFMGLSLPLYYVYTHLIKCQISSGNDSVSIKPPPENASVAEAKPVAVSIAGEGGVASAQPVGQAIVGPGGLAVSRPVATAIAGIPGAENLVLKPEKVPGTRDIVGYTYSVYHPQVTVFRPILHDSSLSSTAVPVQYSLPLQYYGYSF